jgi:hypothetical protein
MLSGLTTPGSRSSEFLVTVLNVLVQLVLALTDTINNGTAAKLGVAGTLAYVLSRGLAKYETRGPVAPPNATPPPKA